MVYVPVAKRSGTASTATGGSTYVSVADRDAFRKAVSDAVGMDIIPGQEMSVYNQFVLKGAVSGIPDAPMDKLPGPGVVKTFLQNLAPSIINGVKSYFAAQDERRATQTFGEQAYTELVQQPLQILKAVGVDLPRMILGGLSGTGKSVLEAVYTPIFGKESARAPLFGTAEEQKKAEEFLYGSEAKSWQQIKEDVDSFTASSPLATAWEKKNLGLTLAVAGFASDVLGGGGKGKLPAHAIKELVEVGDEYVAKEIMLKYGVPKQLAETAAFAVTRAKSAIEVEDAIKNASKAILKSTEDLAPAAKEAVKTTIDDEIAPLINKAREYKTPEEFVDAARNLNPEELGVSREAIQNTIFKAVKPSEGEEGVVKALTDFWQKAKAATDEGSIPKPKDLEPQKFSNIGKNITSDQPIPTYQQLYDLETRAARGTTQDELDNLTAQLSAYEDAIDLMPGKKLIRYVSRATGRLPEITGTKTKKSIDRADKEIPAGVFSQRGDGIIQELFGYENKPDWDMAQKAVDDYRELRQEINQLKDTVIEKRKNLSSARKIERISKAAMADRRLKLRALQDRYQLDDKEMQKIRGRRDISAMEPQEFDRFMRGAENAAEDSQKRSEALVQLKGTIFEKELQKVDNLREAMELPPLSQMNADQIKQFDEVLQQFKQGDEFLSVRKLELVDRTDLAGIKTVREATEHLVADVNAQRAALGQAPITAEDISKIKVGELDQYRYDPALARRNAFYQLMVEEKTKAFLNANLNFQKIREDLEGLIKNARASRSRSIADRLIPTDKKIFEWLEAADTQKATLAKDMTREELDAAHYVRTLYAEARDYLVQQKVLKKYRSDYITHIRRGFLETVKEDGLVRAFKEAFQQYKLDEAMFNILDQKTGEVLPLEKFFRFSMRRTGELTPTQNVAKAVEAYFSSLEKKKALDSLVPKLDIYVYTLTPKKLTPRGLDFDDSLKRFFNEWMNTKKGRTKETIVKPGGKMDWALRTGVALTRLIDLGFSIPIGISSAVGEQAANFIAIGAKKEALGVARLATSRGREIIKKYEAFTDEPVLKKLMRASGDIGDKFTTAAFGLFAFGSRKANEVFLLGSLTKEEFAQGAIDPKRLAQIQLKMAKYRVVPDMESIIGKTAPGKVFTQYRSWAVPLLSASLRNFAQFSRAVRARGFADAMQKEESVELLRSAVFLSVVGFGVYGFVQSRTDKKASDMTFTEEVAFKAARDSLSLAGALDPSLFSSQPRLFQFIERIGQAASQIVNFEHTKDGELKGIKTIQSTATPALVRQLGREFDQGEKNTGPAGQLPDLPDLPPLPKLPKIPTF